MGGERTQFLVSLLLPALPGAGTLPARKTGTRLRSFSICQGGSPTTSSEASPPLGGAGSAEHSGIRSHIPRGEQAVACNPRASWHSGICSFCGSFVDSTRGSGERGDTTDSSGSHDSGLARGSQCGSRRGEFRPRAAVAEETAHVSRRVAPSAVPPPLFSHHNEIRRWRWLRRLALRS